MKLSEYEKLNPTKKLENFINTLSITNKMPDYFVNWQKVYRNTRKYEKHLNTLNYLIGKENIIEEANVLFREQPRLLEAVPSLLASREPEPDFLVMEDKELIPMNLNFDVIDTSRLDEYIKFMKETGLLDFIKNHANMSLVDFVYGVETGLDSNARKNRSGTTMENLVENFLKETKKLINIDYIVQASASQIQYRW